MEQKNEPNYSALGVTIKQYTHAVLSMNILKEKQRCDTLSVETAEGKIEYHNSKENPSLLELISDIVNSEKERIPDGEEFVVSPQGVGVYQARAKIKRDELGNLRETKIQITKQVVEDEDNKLVFQPVDLPTVKVTYDADNSYKYDIEVNGRIIFNDKSPMPRELQRGVIEKYAEKMMDDAPHQLAIMGTATGKSWVIAGVTHALGGGVIVVPDSALASEMKNDAIGILHGEQAKGKVCISKDYDTVEAFSEALQQAEQMILVADDPLFHEKAALVRGSVVLMDESHQHTFNERSLETLNLLKSQNAILALTGTPTCKLKQVIGNETMVDVNVRWVMDRGGLRPNCRRTDTNVISSKMIETAMKGYFGRDEYPMNGKGLMSIDAIRAKIKSGMPEEEAIDLAINTNRQRALKQKNFIFTGDDRLRKDWLESYQEISDGSYPRLIQLETSLRNMRRDAEVDARLEILKMLHPDENPATLYVRAEEQATDLLRVNLVNEILESQKAQIAQSINAHALSLVFPLVKARDFESMLRRNTIDEFLQNNQNSPSEINEAKLNDLVKGLPEAQREQYLQCVRDAATRIQNSPRSVSGLYTADDINLDAMGAKYTASATTGSKLQPKTTDAESAAILDGLRTGLIMHVASDKIYTTGISIPSVLSVQQMVASTHDSLDNPVDAPQLHGRNIRADDLAAFNQQVVSNQVPEGSWVQLEDIYSHESGAKMEKVFQVETERESKKQAFRELKGKFEEVYSPSKPDQGTLGSEAGEEDISTPTRGS